jgi:hypothetical protein
MFKSLPNILYSGKVSKSAGSGVLQASSVRQLDEVEKRTNNIIF